MCVLACVRLWWILDMFCSHGFYLPPTPTSFSLPIPFPDSWWLGFCGPFSLIRATCVTILLELSIGDWWGHQCVLNWRQWLPLPLDLSVGSSSAMRRVAPTGPHHCPCLAVDGSVLVLTHSSRPQLVRAENHNNCLVSTDGISQTSLYFLALAFFLPLLQCSSSLGGDSINYLFGTECLL